MTVVHLATIRADLAQIAADADRSYLAPEKHFASLWANVGRHAPALVAEVERLRAELLTEKADLVSARAELVRSREKAQREVALWLRDKADKHDEALRRDWGANAIPSALATALRDAADHWLNHQTAEMPS